jgi:hypothetical protein
VNYALLYPGALSEILMTAEFSLLAFANNWVICLDAALYLLSCVVCCTTSQRLPVKILHRVLVENWEGGMMLTPTHADTKAVKSEKLYKWLTITYGNFWYEKKFNLPVRCDIVSRESSWYALVHIAPAGIQKTWQCMWSDDLHSVPIK